MKKILLALALLLAISIPKTFAATDVAIGLEFGGGGLWGTSGTGGGGFGGAGFNMAFGATPDKQEWATTVGVSFGNGIGINGHFEKYMIHHGINEWFFLYLGLGAGLNYMNANGAGGWDINATFNVPLGMRFLPEGWIDIFLELVPVIGMATSNANNNTNIGFAGGLNANFGIRFWIGAGEKATAGNSDQK